MRSLQQQIERNRRLSRGILAAMVVGVLAFAAAGYWPARRAAAEQDRQIADRQQELNEARIKAANLPVIAGEVERLRSRLARSRKLLLASDLPIAHREIMQISQRTGLGKFKYEPDAERPGTLYRELPIQMTFEGDFFAAFAFLRQCEDLPRLSRFRRLLLRTTDKGQGGIQAEVSMSLFLTEP
jgi:Tfp pilus assembly protein PilO